MASILKCPGCVFLTTSASRLDEHIRTGHIEEEAKVLCPGCPNSFPCPKSLQTHLESFHRVDPAEMHEIMILATQIPSNPPAAKSRIFIKSVDVLRNPNPVYPCNDDLPCDPFQPNPALDSPSANALIDLCEAAEELSPEVPRQKIYLKNVNELQDQQSQNNLFEFEQDLQTMSPFQPQPSFAIPEGDQLPAMDFMQDPPKDKIYIRNVQTLIRPEVQMQQEQQPPNSSSYLHLRSLDDINLMNMEEVQGLPQRNGSDIVVLLEEECPFYNQALSPPVNHLPVPVDNCQKIPESGNFNLHNEVNNFPGMFRSDCPPIDETYSFYCKALEENISAGICPPVEPQECRIETPPETVSDQVLIETSIPVSDNNCETPEPLIVPTVFAKGKEDELDQELNTLGNKLSLDNVICLPDESDTDERQTTIALPQMPRIYVSNLSELVNAAANSPVPSPANNNDQVVKKGPRGRPKGGRNYSKCPADFPFKCPESECPRRFRDSSKLEYHQRCHDPVTKQIVCPECTTSGLTKWSILHTHLWRVHGIDMELYACPQCSFKTPCLSSLNNVHLKTHSEEKNFKCELCERAFKNQKQLKNHRRNHRLSLQKISDHQGVMPSLEVPKKSRAGVAKKKPSREEKNPKTSSTQIFTCDVCPYETNHRNSARRHKMAHSGERKYKCGLCDYSCIQSNSYRIHLQRVHPREAETLIHNCPECSFATINRLQLKLHQAKHLPNQEPVKERVQDIL